MKHTLRLVLCLLLSSCLGTSYGQIYSYTNDSSGAYNSVAANATGVKLTRYNGATKPASACASGFSAQGFGTTSTYATTLPAIEADAKAATGYVLNVTGFSADLRRSGSGADSARLAYSTDGGATWTDKGYADAPNNGGCGSTTTATWTTSVIVSSSNTLKLRIYGFNASLTSGTIQVLNLSINGTVATTDSVFTSAASFGPFCQGAGGTISVPFTYAGSFTGPFYVQLSNSAGVFPADATSNLISTGTSTSPASATIPTSAAAGTGYRVRVVNQNPTYYTSGDNGSNIVINPSLASSIYDTLCPGGSKPFAGANLTASGTYTNPLTTVNGCDSTITLYLTVLTAQRDTVLASVCQGSGYTFHGTSYTTAGSYSDTLSCDSISTLVLSYLPVSRDTVTASVCQGSGYTYNGVSYTTAGAYSDTVRCDSIVTLVLSYLPVLRDTVRLTICAGNTAQYNGTTYSVPGTYSDTVRCDSIVTLVLINSTIVRDTIHGTICQGNGYPFNGATYSTPGTYSDTVRCDSIVTLVLNLSTTHRDTVLASVCQGSAYPFNGASYSTAGAYSDTVRCDSIVTLVLSYKPVLRDTVTASVCQGNPYSFNGSSYTTAGAYSDTVRCDSIVTLVLSYKPVLRDTIPAAICRGGSYPFHGTVYSVPGAYSDTVRCDSIVTLVLTVHPNPTAVATLTGVTHLSTTTFSTYQWLFNNAPITGATSQNYTATQNGNYSVIVTDANGCTDTSNIIAVVIIGITETNTISARIYPSPTEGLVYIDADGVTSIEVIDMIGRTMLSTVANKNTTHNQIDLTGYTNGVYSVILRGANNAVSIRNIVKQ